jgi:PAS domain S-box-containing protein
VRSYQEISIRQPAVANYKGKEWMSATTATEELRAANEELARVNEKLQERNEELARINQELHGRNSNLSNVLCTVDMPILMVGRDLRIRQFTPITKKVLNLTSTDLGRPLSDIQANIPIANLEALILEVIDTLSAKGLEVQDGEGRWYSLQIRPYQTADNRIDGTVISFIDIDALKRDLQEVENSRDYCQAIVEAVRTPLVVLTAELRVKTANGAFYQAFRVSPQETENAFIYHLGNGQWDIPRLKKLLEQALAKEQVFRDFCVHHEFSSIGPRIMLLHARRLKGMNLILLSIEDVTEPSKLQQEIQVSEVRYRRLFETAQDGILLLEADTGEITDVNPYLMELLGYSRSELVGRELWEIGPFKDAEASQAAFRALQDKKYIRYEDLPLKTRDGRKIEVEFVSNVYEVDAKKVIQCNIREITERKRAEQQMQASLEEKEVLLKEIHHRVKNNLQVISSLLNLQAGYVKDREALELFKESQGRVRSIALIHETLYHSSDLGRIDFAAYVQELAANLFSTYGVNSEAIRLKVSAQDILLGVDTAIPCGLIVNELISNSLKHAFPAGRQGEISIELHSEGENRLTLVVRDDGVGLPKNLDLQELPSLGLRIVSTLTDQLNGTLELQSRGGAEFKITFPEPNQSRRGKDNGKR